MGDLHRVELRFLAGPPWSSDSRAEGGRNKSGTDCSTIAGGASPWP